MVQPHKETKESRARRGKVAHLRERPPFAHTTVCGVDPDSAGVKAVGREVFDNAAAAGQACKNCVRGAATQLRRAREAVGLPAERTAYEQSLVDQERSGGKLQVL
jgi:hypothetical protein